MAPKDNESLTANLTTRRSFIKTIGLGAAALGLAQSSSSAEEKVIQGFEKTATDPNASKGWQPVSDRKIRVGIAGYGLCCFGAAFGFQNHPNIEIIAVTDLIPDRCAGLAKACRCSKTYPSLEEMVKDEKIEAVFVATDAPSHAQHCMKVMQHGKHVATAVPAVFGSLEDAEKLLATVKSTGMKYMMFETSCFHDDLYAMRQIYKAGGFGKLVYSEGEYYHYSETPIGSYKGWRDGLPPQWYPTHSNAYYIGVTDGSFTEVSCMGIPSHLKWLQPENNRYKNPFGTEIALFRSNEGGMARMAVSWDSAGHGGEKGRIRGQRGSFSAERKPTARANTAHGRYEGFAKTLPDINRPPLPPGVEGGGHGGSHGPLMNEFVTAILENRQPLVNVAMALNLTVSGIVAHQSALKDGELMKIPQYKF